MRSPLPIDAALPAVLDALRAQGAVVVLAPPGSGKTTRVPQAVLDAIGGRALLLQPRRVAARLCAARIAWERGGELGGEVGYQVRFERRVGPQTRLEVLTEGLLLRRLQEDPFLEGVDTVLLDEFHERSLHLDLSLALLAEVRAQVRPELRLVVMSATLDPGPVARFLGGCPVVVAEGRTFPVEVQHDPRPDERPLPLRVAAAIRARLPEEGHVLAFLPGVGEIERTLEALGPLPGRRVLPLHSRLSLEEQARALAPSAEPRVVLATNIAETSVTFDGVRVVVDSGQERRPVYDPALGLERLERVPIAQSSAAQRAGRAGRTGPGLCRRLWTEAEHRERPAAALPEVQRADLAPAVLELRAWGADPRRFGWFEPPPPAALARAEQLLQRLGALDDGALTPLGQALARLPVHPRVGAVLLAGQRRGLAREAATLAALLSERDPFPGDQHPERADLLWRVQRVEEGGASERGLLRAVRQARDQLLALAPPHPGPRGRADARALAELLLAGFPDRVAVRREGSPRRYRLVGGAGAALPEGQQGPPLVLALELEAGPRGERSEHTLRLACALEEAWLPTRWERVLRFDPEREAVRGRRERRYLDLILGEAPDPEEPDPEAVSALLAQEAAKNIERIFTLDDETINTTQRLRCIIDWMPEQQLPPAWDLRWALPALCQGRRSFAELRALDLSEALLGLLSWPQRQALEQHAPARLPVPSGATVRLRYEHGQPPVLAARVQQLFGLMQTPRIAGGRVPVLIELLSPAQRPVQVTADLAGFWASSYAEVRKELRGRYPKWAWPEDPSQAIPEDRPARRRS